MPTFTGTNASETITGSAAADILQGLGGGDILIGGDGADALDGGTGADYASYSDSPVGVVANLGNPGANTGFAAGDTYTSIENLEGSAGNDTLVGDAGSNVLRGLGGADALNGGGGFDYAGYFTATSGLTVNLANPNANTGEAIGDTYISIEGISGSGFNDTLVGDAGDNFFRGNGGADVLDGGAGFDFADHANASSGVTANLANSSLNTGEAAGDTYISIEGLSGSAFNDVLVGDASDNSLRGQGGADTLDGGAGFDFAEYRNASAGVQASLLNASTNTGEAAGDVYFNIEGLVGSDFNDVLIGNGLQNFLRGGLGADTLNGGLSAGLGDDQDFADYRNSSVGLTVSLANPAANTGEAAGDVFINIESIRGSNFADTLIGDGNNNSLRGGLGADALDGGTGIDTASYSNSSAGLTVNLANAGANTGEAAGDTFVSIENLRGSSFADTLIGDGGSNVLDGNLGADVLDGGAGIDQASYANAAVGVFASLINPGANTGEAAGDSYVSIEGLRGSGFDDYLVGDTGANLVEGGLGNDTVDGRIGDDLITGGAGNDYLYGGGGRDTISGGDGDDAVVAGGSDATVLDGGAGADVLVGGSAADYLSGGSGADYLYGNGGLDTLAGGDGDDAVVAGGTSRVLMDGGAGNDVLVGGTGNDYLYGGSGQDYLYAGAGDDQVVAGGDGGSVLLGNEGYDFIVGGGGADQIYGGTGYDLMYGGAGDDLFVIYRGDTGDYALGEAGRDTLFFADRSVTELAGVTANGNGYTTVSLTDGSAFTIAGIEVLAFSNASIGILS